MVTFCGEIRKDRMVCSILFHHSYTESARANSALRAIPIEATLLSATMKIFLIRHMHMHGSEFNDCGHHVTPVMMHPLCTGDGAICMMLGLFPRT